MSTDASSTVDSSSRNVILRTYSSPSQLSGAGPTPAVTGPRGGATSVPTGVGAGEEGPSDGASPVVEGGSSPPPAPGAGAAGDDGASATTIACAGAIAIGAGAWPGEASSFAR